MPLNRVSNTSKNITIITLIIGVVLVFIYLMNSIDSQTSNNNSSNKTSNKDNSQCPPVTPCKCFDATENIEQDGQVTMQTTFGKALNSLAKQEDVNLFLEIGTWFGGGSTFVLYFFFCTTSE